MTFLIKVRLQMCCIFKTRDGLEIGGSIKEINEAIQAEQSQIHKEQKQNAVSWRAQICGGRDPFTFQTKDKKEEIKLTQELNRIVWRSMGTEIEELRHEISMYKHTNFQNKKQMEEMEENIHRLQTLHLETLVIRLRLPYLIGIQDLKPIFERWGKRQTKILRMFTRRLMRALPFAFKWHLDKDLIENAELGKIFCPEDPKDFIEDSDWNLLNL